MSDERLRQLERKWRETGSLTDEAAYLTERLRQGLISPDVLDLAAFCGNPAAASIRDVAGSPYPWRPTEPPLLIVAITRPLPSLLKSLSTESLRTDLDGARAVFAHLGHADETLQIHGVSSELIPDTQAPPSPADYFGWGVSVDASEVDDLETRLRDPSLAEWSTLRAGIAIGRRRFVLQGPPDDPIGALYALCEWMLGDRSEWVDIGPQDVPTELSPTGRAIMSLATSEEWWGQELGLPFTPAGSSHPLAQALGSVLALQWRGPTAP